MAENEKTLLEISSFTHLYKWNKLHVERIEWITNWIDLSVIQSYIEQQRMLHSNEIECFASLKSLLMDGLIHTTSAYLLQSIACVSKMRGCK